VERARAAALHAFKNSTGAHCLMVFAAADGQLTMTIGDQTVSHPLPS
jgi:hypothetical protein